MITLDELINNEKWPGINAITFENREMILLDIQLNQNSFWIHPLVDSTIDSYLKYNQKNLSSFEVYSTAETADYRAFVGAGSYEAEGIIYVRDTHTEQLIWSLFMENSEYFKSVTIKSNRASAEIHAVNEAHFTWIIPIKNPLQIRIVNPDGSVQTQLS